MIDSVRWQRMQSLFHEALELPPSEHNAFLSAACGDDEELLKSLLDMLRHDASAESFLDKNLAELADSALESPNGYSIPLRELGPYQLIKVLGEGGMGVVYLAKRTDLGNYVAIKILRDAWLSPARRDRFASEQRTLAQLTHPSIAQLYDADTLEDGTPWFVMEHVEGLPLTEYCRQHKASIEERLRLFRAVCDAVQYAHRQAVIHRDLKPSNILVKEDASIRLLDFGIAKQLETLDAPIEQTMTGLRLLTPAYAAPEQVRGGRIGVHTDVYSLGVILFELLTSQLPFDLSNLSPSEAAAIIAEHDPLRPSAALKRNVSSDREMISTEGASWADLDVLCLTAMHKDPNRRYKSVEALIRDVDHYLNGEPLEARVDSVNYRLGKFVRRNRRAVIAGLTVFSVIVTLIVFFTVRLAKAKNSAIEEAARTQRVQSFMMNLFEGGDSSVGPADSLKVTTLLDRGVQEAQALNGDPKQQAELYETLGGIYQKLGKLDRADSLFELALQRHIAIYGSDSAETATTLIKVGLLRADQAKLKEAEKSVRQGLEILQRKTPPKGPAVARATAALGKVLEDRGTYDQAIRTLNEAVTLQSSSGLPLSELASSLSELANSHYYAGHYKDSESLNKQVLVMQRQLYGDRHPLIADTLINLGAIQLDLGHYPEAEQYDRQALDITRAWYGEDHPETASALTILGRVLVSEGRTDEATKLLQDALRIQEKVYGKVHPRVASALNELGRTAKIQGKYKDAEAIFIRMTDIYRSVYGDNHYLIGISLSNLGSVYFDEGKLLEAEKIFRDVVNRFTRTLSADHLNTAIARIKLGRVFLKQKRFREAEVESRAGYEILAKQASPSLSWLQNARTDLAEEYGALHQTELATRFHTEAVATRK